MKRILTLTFAFALASVGSSRTQQAPQIVIGTISESICGASHQAKADTLTERQCIFVCLKALAKWVIVDQDEHVFVIGNQDLPGLALYAGRPVRLTGELKDGAIVASRIEAYPPHLHILHVMTNWRDTPGGVGLLIAAISDARVAVVHANLAGRHPDNLDDMKLHTGHVLHALDPGIEPKGPGSGYGVTKAAAGAQQHLGFAAEDANASPNVKTHATHVAASLRDALQRTHQAITVAQKIRAATTAAEAAPLVEYLNALVAQITEASLAQAHADMTLMIKGEGIKNAPR